MTAFRLIAALLAALACVTLLACGDDDDNAKPTATTSERATPTDTGDEPSPDEKLTPTDEASPVGTDEPGGDTPTPPPPAAIGTPAVAPEDQGAYVRQFEGREVVQEQCVYNPSTRLTDCDARGQYAVDPPLAGQDISCSIGIVDGTLEFIRCSSIEPPQSLYYEIVQ